MNTPPKEYILVAEARELAFLEECFRRAGLEEEHVHLVSRLLTNAELRGVRSHGIGWAFGYCQQLKDGKLNPRPQVRPVHETAAAVVLDGDGSLGYLPMTRATERAIAKAGETGVGLGLVRHIGHYGSAGHYTRLCAEAGCAGFSVQGFRHEGDTGGTQSRPSTAFTGFPKIIQNLLVRWQLQPKPSVAFTGFPPMSFAIPAGEEPAVVLDMVAHTLSGYSGREYSDLPERVPAAFFKSMGLVAAANLLGGALTGFTLPEGDEIERRWPGAGMGGMVLAISVAALVPGEAFRKEVDRYVRAIRDNYAPLPGYTRVQLPGAVEVEAMERHRREGIRFGEREQRVAQKLHEYLGVPLPWG